MDYNHPIYEIRQPLPSQGFMEGLSHDEIEAVREYLINEVVVQESRIDGSPLVRDRVNEDSERQATVIWQHHVWACYVTAPKDSTMRVYTIKFGDYFKFRKEFRGHNLKKFGV